MRDIATSDQIEMIVDDPQADREVIALARENGWRLRRLDQGNGSHFIINR